MHRTPAHTYTRPHSYTTTTNAHARTAPIHIQYIDSDTNTYYSSYVWELKLLLRMFLKRQRRYDNRWKWLVWKHWTSSTSFSSRDTFPLYFANPDKHPNNTYHKAGHKQTVIPQSTLCLQKNRTDGLPRLSTQPQRHGKGAIPCWLRWCVNTSENPSRHPIYICGCIHKTHKASTHSYEHQNE
jgi:hypothetical protein